MARTKTWKRNSERKTLHVSSWNLRTLLESSGDARIRRKRTDTNAVDRKLDLMVSELTRYRVGIAGIQESKWFGNDVWRVGDGTFVHSGRPLPADDGDGQRGEGVGIYMDAEMTRAWKSAGETWTPVSSRIVSARFKLSPEAVSLPVGFRTGRSASFLTVINIYAPTSKAPPHIKNKFVDELQLTIDNVRRSDQLVILGDFNARVGSRSDDESLNEVLGAHGFGNCNSAGEDLLLFCNINRLSIMNTWFKKQFYGTWMHPATKEVHLIDFIIVRADQRDHWHDVQVMRGAICWTDHSMMRGKFSYEVGHKRYYPQATIKTKPIAINRLREEEVSKEFSEKVSDLLPRDRHDDDANAEQQWTAMRDGMLAASTDVLGYCQRKQPDWFLANEHILRPIIERKNSAHQEFLQKNTPTSKSSFRKRQRDVQQAVVAAKEKWIESIASVAENVECDGRTRWECIRKLQSVAMGRISSRPLSVLDENGNITSDPMETCQRWQRHFSGVLNIESQFSAAAIESINHRTVRHDLDEPPTHEEINRAISKMKLGKAGGESGVLPDMLAHAGPSFREAFHRLLGVVWSRRSVVDDWSNAVLCQFQKKGDLRSCDNWRGISLLDVVGKVFARILQDRLQILAEEFLPDSQCGFRRNRGCTDMIFCARQLLEETLEHNSSLYVLFVDLKKAYDSIPRAALWQVLERLGVPPTMLRLVQSLHDDMVARVRINGNLSDSISVTNGLRQGCTLAPTLFNIYFGAVVADWRARCPDAGVDVRYRHGRRLVGDRTVKSRLTTTTVTESQFADDAALYATNRSTFEQMTSEFVRCAGQWGLTVSIQKTKGMAVGRPLSVEPVSLSGDQEIEVVKEFRYLGSILSDDGSVQRDLTARLSQASSIFGVLRSSIFQSRHLSIKTKRMVYRTVVLTALLYGTETWPIKADHIRRLNVFHHACVRTILGISRRTQWEERLSSAALSGLADLDVDMADVIRKHRLRWLGHVARMDVTRLPKHLLFGELPSKRPQHGPKKRWRDVILSDLKTIGMPETEWYESAQERPVWFQCCQERVEPDHTPPAIGCANARCGRVFRRPGDLKRHAPFCKFSA